MQQLPMRQLQWGLEPPEDAVAAWGARLIVTQDGDVDFVPDRVDLVGDGAALVARLEAAYPMKKLTAAVGQLLAQGKMHTRRPGEFVLYADLYADSGIVEVHADTRGSGGYCYVGAWLRAGSAP